jgi:flagellar hook-associated protein 2
MTRIQSSVGLISGIPIQETVNQLIEVASQPKKNVTDRNKLLSSEKLAVTQLSSLLVAFQFESNQLGSTKLFDSKTVSSSKTAALSATLIADGNPTAGTYLFTPVQTASAQQVLSQSFAKDAPVGAGTLTFQTGGFVDKGVSLDQLNLGAGIQRGSIRITDRNGDKALIDLSTAQSVDDVIKAINNNTSINVTATAEGDHFKLTDNTGGTGNLIVQDVAGGTTAVGLGLAGINVAASTADGTDVFALHVGTKLTALNDGNGVQLRSGNDLAVTLADESTLDIDLGTATTLGDVITAINAADPLKLSAQISADGNRIEVTDLTAGAGTFAVANVGVGTAATDLGLTNTVAGGTITGSRLVSGLRDTLVSSLRGGQGLGTLGQIDITNRANVSFSVDLSAAETLGEIVSAINDQSTDVTASVNAARNGIVLNDTSGGTAVNFQVSDGDANESATALGIVFDDAATTVNSGTLARQQVSEATLLSALNKGKGIKVGDFTIRDSAGKIGAVDLNPTDDIAVTVGDVINRINALTIGVEARINDEGDGIVLVDTAGGTQSLTVSEVGGGTTAKDLRIKGTSVEVDVNGTPTKQINGTAKSTVEIGEDDTLADVVESINALGAGVTASIVNDATGQRLSLTGGIGAANELLYDTAGSTLQFQQINEARDAVLLYGSKTSPGGGVLFSSQTDTFASVVEGVTLTVKDGSTDPVTVTVTASSAPIVKAVQEFVDAYNSIRDILDEVTDFDQESLTTGILFGSNEALRIESDLSRVLTGRFFGVGNIQSLEALGISLDDKGHLEFESAKLTAAYNSDPEALRTLFTDKTSGLATKIDAAVERLAGKASTALLTSRADTLTRKIDANTERIAFMDLTLERQRERLLNDFYRIETVIAGMQTSLDALSTFQPIPSLLNQT